MRRSGFPSHSRNQQPAAQGRTFRTNGAGGPGEMDYLRESIQKGLARMGSLFVHWRRFTGDWNDGECDRCFYQEGRTAARADCEICLGTGWSGGFSRPCVQWMIVNDTRTDIQLSRSGFLTVRQGQSYSPAVPRIRPGDVLAKLGLSRDATVDVPSYATGDRYVVTGIVEDIRGRDQVDSIRNATDDHLDPEPEVVGYNLQTALIPRNTEDRFQLQQWNLTHEGAIWLADPSEMVVRP